MRWQGSYLLLWAAILGAQDGSAPDAILARIKARVADNVSRIPIMCARRLWNERNACRAEKSSGCATLCALM